MIDRRAHGGRKNAGGLILLSVAWVAMLGLVPQSSDNGDQTGGGGGTTHSNDIKIEYTCFQDPNGTYDVLDQRARDAATNAFGKVSQNIIFSSGNTPFYVSDATFEIDNIDDLRATYKGIVNYPYWLVSVRRLTRHGVLVPSNHLGETPVEQSPGNDGRSTLPFSILIWENIDAAVTSHNGDVRWWSMTVVHELGHMRAALTHPSESPQYHYPEATPNGRRCVMHLMDGLTDGQIESILHDREFCGDKDDYGQGIQSCLRYIYERGLK